DMSYELIDILNVMTIQDVTKDSDKVPAVGSYRWKAQKYPGDIDMLEFYHVEDISEEVAIGKISDALQKVANDIDKHSELILADFKCGYDDRFHKFIKNLGDLRGSYVSMDMVEYFERDIFGYNKPVCVSELNNLVSIGAITDEFKEKVVGLLPPTMTGQKYSEIYGLMRNFYILRWSLNEIENGAKVILPRIPNKETHVVKLKDAIPHDTLCKIDMWAKVFGRWTELTNLYQFTHTNNSGGKVPIGFYFRNTVDEGTETDIIYYSSQEHEKPYKLAKRIWNRAILKVSHEMVTNTVDPTQLFILKTLFPFFSSDITILGQSMADIELFITALEKHEKMDLTYEQIYKDLIGQIETISQKLFRVMLLESNINGEIKQKVDNIINFITTSTESNDYRFIYDKLWNKIYEGNNLTTLIDMLNNLYSYLSSILNSNAKEYLIKTKLHPRIENSYVHPKYSYNYLNLPKITLQEGGQDGSLYNDKYVSKYYKYKTKYLNLKRK
ncbi:MAG: V21, partial [Homavirus sp.]